MFAKLSKSQHQLLAVCHTIRTELLPILFNKRSVELHASPWYHGWPIQRKGLAFTYQESGEAPWATEFLRNLGSDIKFLAQIKIVQPLHGAQTIQHSTVWREPLEVIYEKLRSCFQIRFETEEAGVLSPDIFIDMAFWQGQGLQHCLQAKVPKQKGPELIFEYQLEPKYGEGWTIGHVEKLYALHRSMWRLPNQRFDLR